MHQPTLTSSGFEYPRVLSIAGSDSGGGAGIQADLKTFAALGCYGMTAITAVTAQNTQRVQAIHGLPAAVVRQQLDTVLEDIGTHAVKIGMLHSLETIDIVAEAIDRHALKNVVLDPVMMATSGTPLMEKTAAPTLVHQLFHRASLVTPNLDEATWLLGRRVVDELAMEVAARELIQQGASAILLKGGHLSGETVSDVLVIGQGPAHWMRGDRIHTANSHGTGCTLSSAIAAYLAQGATLVEAVEAGRRFVRDALAAGAAARTGAGNGPLNHGFDPKVLHARHRHA